MLYFFDFYKTEEIKILRFQNIFEYKKPSFSNPNIVDPNFIKINGVIFILKELLLDIYVNSFSIIKIYSIFIY